MSSALISKADLDGQLNRLIETHPVLLFAKAKCPLAFEIQRTLASYGVKFARVNINKLPSELGSLVQARLRGMSGPGTLPLLFVEGQCRGDGSAIRRQETRLEFQAYIAKHADFAKAAAFREPRAPSLPLLHFPAHINGQVTRCCALLTAVYTLVCCVYFDDARTQPWAVLALAIDLFLRLIGGPVSSPIGVLATCLGSFLPPNLVPGEWL